MSLNSRLQPTKIIGQRKTFYRQRIAESSCASKETVDIDILVPSRNVDRKIIQSIRMMRRPPSRKGKWSQLSQFWRISTKVMPNIARRPPPDFLKEGDRNFRLPPQRWGIWKIKRRGGSMVLVQVFLKKKGGGGGGGWHFSYLIFLRFIILTFRNYFTLCKIALCIFRKIIFFYHHNIP